jgi:hypothetical protein
MQTCCLCQLLYCGDVHVLLPFRIGCSVQVWYTPAPYQHCFCMIRVCSSSQSTCYIILVDNARRRAGFVQCCACCT